MGVQRRVELGMMLHAIALPPMFTMSRIASQDIAVGPRAPNLSMASLLTDMLGPTVGHARKVRQHPVTKRVGRSRIEASPSTVLNREHPPKPER